MITPRLEMIIKNVSGKSVADIGTDHAYIPIALAGKGIRVIATDVNRGPLDIAEGNIKKYGYNIELRQGNGLSCLKPYEIEEIIIAGMGGELIQKIIENDFETASSAILILQPMNSQYELRRFLYDSGFAVIKEDLAKEGHKIYNLILAKQGKPVPYESELDCHLPPCLYGHPLFHMLAEKKKREFSRRYQGLLKSQNADIKETERLKMLLNGVDMLLKKD